MGVKEQEAKKEKNKATNLQARQQVCLQRFARIVAGNASNFESVLQVSPDLADVFEAKGIVTVDRSNPNLTRPKRDTDDKPVVATYPCKLTDKGVIIIEALTSV